MADTLEGILERVVFFNEENNFTVARLQSGHSPDLITIVGNLPDPNPGETLRLQGEWIVDAKFGRQFRVASCISILPSTLTGIQKYLGSGLVKGIGPIMAGRVVAKFGLETLINAPRQMFPIDIDKAIQWVQSAVGMNLAEMQQEAIKKAVTSKVLVITGGPGTGKTTLLNSLLRILEKKNQRILLASPTGRAAKRLAEVTGREAKTIHRLLEYSPREGGFKRNEDNLLEADLVIIDEVSMLDILLMNNLLKAIPPIATLLLVGDVDQLPSVGPGNVLGDIIASGRVETMKLTEVFRQAQESLIIVNAHRINRGEFPVAAPPQDKKVDFYFNEREDPEQALALIKDLCAVRLPKSFHLDSCEDIQVMTPMHRGLVGVTSLNAELQMLLNPTGKEVTRGGRCFRINDKVMQIVNNYEKEVFNGDIGRVVEIEQEDQKIVIKYDDRMVEYGWNELDELVLAYAISIHKSQGSEYPAVVVPLLSQHYIMLQRNLLYTAITRARKLVVLVGSRKAMAMAIRNNKVQHRYTGLSARLAASGIPSPSHSLAIHDGKIL